MGPPRGKPRRPLLEAALVLTAFYASAFIPFGPGAGRIASPAFHAGILALDALRVILLLFVMARADGLGAFGLEGIRRADPLKGLLAALGAFAILALPSLAFLLLGLSNPIMAKLPRGTAWSLAPLLLASSLATGYAEELCFRAYLFRRFAGAGMPASWAALASSLLFGASHGAQGLVGIVSATLVGLWFARRWQDGRNIHEIAIGHGIYDSAVLALALYA
jgi:membrane protease YdiL (CAAX protease family)